MPLPKRHCPTEVGDFNGRVMKIAKECAPYFNVEVDEYQ